MNKGKTPINFSEKIGHKAWIFWKEFSRRSFEVLSVLQSKYFWVKFFQNFLVQLCWTLKFIGCKICRRKNLETFERNSSVKRFFVYSQPLQRIRIFLMFVAKDLVIFSAKYKKICGEVTTTPHPRLNSEKIGKGLVINFPAHFLPSAFLQNKIVHFVHFGHIPVAKIILY